MPGIILSSRFGKRETLPPLRPGERVINARVYYSAAWLDAHDLPHLAGWEPGTTKEEKMIYDVTIRLDFETEEEHLGPEFAANVISATVREALHGQGIDGLHGIGCRVTPRGASVNAPKVAA
jgi:hypothetical protein